MKFKETSISLADWLDVFIFYIVFNSFWNCIVYFSRWQKLASYKAEQG